MPHATKLAGPAAGNQPRPEPRLLVIEDETVDRTIIVTIAREAGFAITEAASVAEAEQILGRHAFDGITLDLALGTGFGIDVLRGLAKAGSATPIVIVTGSAESASKLASSVGRMLKLRISGVLTKPIDFDRMRAFLEQIKQAAERKTTANPTRAVHDQARI
jgi:two-component system, OmpR family, response regulator